MDLFELFNQSVTQTLILQPIIMGLVAFSSKLGAKGKVQTAISLGIGFILGLLSYTMVFGVPDTVPTASALILFSLVPGMVASGIYDVGKRFTSKE